MAGRILVLSVFLLAGCAHHGPGEKEPEGTWSVEQGQAWGAKQPWLVGCNFIPSTAINQLEMWQEDTFDPATIDRELGWAADMGMNIVRVYLHDLAWQQDPEGFKARIDQFLAIADGHGIRPMFVIFDDCWNEDPKPGKQPEPRPSVHNSGWLQSPGKKVAGDPEQWGRLQAYVEDVVGTFAKDARILCWDLYNEPGNSGYGEASLPLLQKVFLWARSADPTQPLTAGLWSGNESLNRFQLGASDILTFHNYGDAESLAKDIERFKAFGRPVICTEWLRRGNSEVATSLPLFQKNGVGCINWGLVSGKTQTIYAWGTREGAPAPERWFHDLLHPDGTPYDRAEIALFRQLTLETNGPPSNK